jgi:inorganic pyrophosphatase
MTMPPLLSRLPTTDPNTGDLLAVIETPKGSPNKYDYDDTCAAFRLAEVMPKGSYFPYDFGFIPSTLGDDGDPLDVLVFMDDPAPVGCVLTIRLIGAIEAKQQEKGGDWERNDRLLAVATHAHTHMRTLRGWTIFGPDCWTKSKHSSPTTINRRAKRLSR